MSEYRPGRSDALKADTAVYVTNRGATRGTFDPRIAARTASAQWLVVTDRDYQMQDAQLVHSWINIAKLSPANAGHSQGNTVTLSWFPAGQAPHWVCATRTATGTCDTAWQSVGSAASLQLSGLATGTCYWQVRAGSRCFRRRWDP